jgi:N-acetylneuraminic acid mutarotase
MAIGENWTKIGDLPKRRNHHALINFDSKMWVIGGQNPENVTTNDVLSSEDGINWTYHNSHVGFNLPNISYARPFVLGNSMFIAGGFNGVGITDNIWASKDGDVWILVGKLPQPILYHDIAVLNDVVYCIGGSADGATNLVNVYASRDGVIWNEVGQLPFGLSMHTVTAWKNNLVVVGGYRDGFILSPKIFYSLDGEYWGSDGGGSSYEVELSPELFDSAKAWVEFNADPGYSEYWEETTPSGAGYDNHAAVVFNDEVFIFGGRLGALTGATTDRVWKTDDPRYQYKPDPNNGVWEDVGTNALPYPHLGKNFIVFDDAIWQVGGWTPGIGSVDDVYKSV